MRQFQFLFFVLLIFNMNLSHAFSARQEDLNSEVWGKWKYVGYIYDGHFQDPPNPNLILTFEFLSDGTDLLHWHRVNEVGLCERKGRYSFDGRVLTDEVIWINPQNAVECQRDPDMVLGKVQVTPLMKFENRLYMDLPLADQTLTYIWAPYEQ